MSRHDRQARRPFAFELRGLQAGLAGARCALVAAILALALPRAAAGQVDSSREHQVKAAFLFNFAQFVTWSPASCPATGEPFVIGVLGTDRLGGTLAELTRGARIQDRPVTVERYASADEVGSCQILFVSASETERLAAVFAALAGKNVLTVGETPEFAQRDGVIALLLVNNRLRMEINTAAATTANLSISSKLLRLADVIRTDGS